MIFQILGICILLLFYGCYFTKMFMQKKQGIQTDQIGKGKQGTVKVIEMTMRFVTLAVVFAEVVSIFMGTTAMPEWLRVAGIVIGGMGVVVFIISVVTMKDSWRAGVSKTDKTELVTTGIYSISRNPAFLGFDLVYIGILLMFFNWVLLALTVLAGTILHFQIVNVEEDFLISAFGQQYLDYCKKVNRYFGRKK